MATYEGNDGGVEGAFCSIESIQEWIGTVYMHCKNGVSKIEISFSNLMIDNVN